MLQTTATEFSGILPAVAQDDALRSTILKLIAQEPIAGKVTEGGNRLARFRQILQDLVNNQVGMQEALSLVERDLSEATSSHIGNTRVFPSGWAEKSVRTQLSRFYNQAVMEMLMSEGETECFVPHSSAEDSTSSCSSQLAGKNQNLQVLHSRLVSSYGQGNFSKDVKIPNHPHCTHVVTRKK